MTQYLRNGLRFFYALLFVFINTICNGQLVISEIMASNVASFNDQFENYPDWIEIHNSSSGTVNLSGWALTDSKSNPLKWSFPQVSIPAGGYLVVFASGKNILQPLPHLHTNFSLSASGEYLALVNNAGAFISGFENGYPIQYEDVSYSWVNGAYRYTGSPTPNKPNSSDIFLTPPAFSVKRGVFTAPFSLQLISDQKEAIIRYTSDGSDPGLSNGKTYLSSISVDSTSIIRAICLLNGKMSNSVTSTYIFTDQVLNQPEAPHGYPATWGENWTADYGMDPEICSDPESSTQIRTAFSALPVVSVVSKPSNFFSAEKNADTGGIYVYTNESWERPASFELFTNGKKSSIQVNCGVQLQGGASREPNNSPKHSLRLVFKPEFGPSRLKYPIFDDEHATDIYNTLHLKAGYNNTWVHWDAQQRKSSQYIRDVWSKDVYRQMGNPSVHTRYVNLFINGMYWGLYDISERIDKEFMEAYLKGSANDYDVIKDFGEVVDGSNENWITLFEKVREGLAENAAYFKLLGKNSDGSENLSYPAFIDAANLADYMILNFYGGNDDWDHHNWAAARSRVDNRQGFRFFVWDTERILEDVKRNVLKEFNANCPSEVFQEMAKNSEFKLLLADRVQKHLFNGGSLTPGLIQEDWENFATEIKSAVYAESARWGDYRRDVNPRNSPNELYTVSFWEQEKDRLMVDYFPARTDIVIEQFKNAGWYPAIAAPGFNQYGGLVSSNFKLEMSTLSGTIFYSTKGDPRQVGGTVSPDASTYYSPFFLTDTVITVKARVKSGSTWSALTEATFKINRPVTIARFEDHPDPISNFPNPVKESTTIKCTLPTSENIRFEVKSMDGRTIQTVDLGVHLKGDFSYRFDAGRLTNGIYLYHIRCGNQEFTSRMIVLK